MLIAVALLALAIPQSGTPHQLLRAGGFERTGGWSLSPGASVTRDGARSGRMALRVVSGAAEQTVYGVRPGDALAARGWLRTRDVVPGPSGGFAYLALYQYGPDGALLHHEDFAQVAGTTGWTRFDRVTTVRPGVEYVVYRAGIHNATGEALFDDASLVTGDRPDDWRDLSSTPGPARYRALVLHEPALPIEGCATPPEAFERACRDLGIPVRRVSAREIEDPATLDPDRVSLLIVPTGASFPVEARRALLRFVTGGGDLLCTGGYAFDRLWTRRGGSRWRDYREWLREESEAARKPERSLAPDGGLEEGGRGWTADSPAACVIAEGTAHSGRRSARVRVEQPTGGARWAADLPVRPGQTVLVGAHARVEGLEGAGFAFLAVYQYGADGKLLTFVDFAQMRRDQPWMRHEARVRIVPGAARVVFQGGLYQAKGTVWIDDVTCAPAPAEERINAHYGEPGDALGLSPLQLTLFSPDQPLQGVRVAAARGAGLPPGWASPGVVRGFEATAQLRQAARWTPLVEARDRFGRASGVAGALVRHHSGTFDGSTWAIFGVTNRDLFAGSAGHALLRRTLSLLASGVRADHLAADYAIYRVGETVRLTLQVANGSDTPRRVAAVLSVAEPDSSRPALHIARADRTLAPGERARFPFAWRVPAGAPDMLAASVELRDGSMLVDRVETGFCVTSERVRRGGPLLTYRDNAFTVRWRGRERRVTLFGTDTYGNMFWSRSCSPLTWYRDLRMMADHGLHLFENLQYSRPGYQFGEKEWREFDALVQLAQRFGLPYMAGLLIGADVAVDDATLAAQAAMCREFARRYRDVPGILYYLNGDFRLDLKDTPDLRRLWNDLLRERYGSDEGLRAAWGPEAPAERLGEMPVRDIPPGAWYDVRARDVIEFRQLLVRRWVRALCEAVRSEDRVHPITSEYYQRPNGGIDVRRTIDGMDASNFGYFGPAGLDLAQLPATIKWNDLRFSGKTVNIGEFGIKTHDAWAPERDPWGYQVARDERYRLRLFSSVVHAAWAWGVTKIQNWCWSDDPDGVFPWGMAWNNPLRPKPALLLYRNLRLFSDRVSPDLGPAPAVVVVPSRFRAGAPDALGNEPLLKALELMLATGVPFDVADEEDAPLLAARHYRLIVAPLAYALSDAALAGLHDAASEGALVALSGDPSVTPAGQRDPGRLLRLLGLDGAEPATHPSGLPALRLPAGLTIARRAVGAGAMRLDPEPWETLPNVDLWARDAGRSLDPSVNRYLAIVREAGLAGPRVSATAGVWRAVDRGSGDGRLQVVYGQGAAPARARVTVGEGARAVTHEPRLGFPCAALMDRDGRVRAATGGGRLEIGGRLVARGESPWLAIGLGGALGDGAALAASTEGGPIHVAGDARGMQAWAVEWRNGRASVVGRLPLSASRAGWTAAPDANELVLVCRPEERERWLRALDGFGW